MNLPQVESATAFERFNAHCSTLTFEAPVPLAQQQTMQSVALNFNGGDRKKPAFYLDFTGNGKTLAIRQMPGGDFRVSPTKQDYDDLLSQLEIELPAPAAASQHIAQSGRETQRAAA